MSKKALCISKAALALPELFSGVFTETDYHNLLDGRGVPVVHPLMQQTQLVDRSVCEEDESLLQLIPYVAIRTRTQGMTLVALYQRGKAGEEVKLHDKYSIGFGGHVDTEVPAGESLLGHLASECKRELQEELSLDIPHERLHCLLRNSSYLYLNESAVDRVHLGLVFVLDVSEVITLQTNEPDTIRNLAWTNVQDLRDLAAQGKLENWSRIMVDEELV